MMLACLVYPISRLILSLAKVCCCISLIVRCAIHPISNVPATLFFQCHCVWPFDGNCAKVLHLFQAVSLSRPMCFMGLCWWACCDMRARFVQACRLQFGLVYARMVDQASPKPLCHSWCLVHWLERVCVNYVRWGGWYASFGPVLGVPRGILFFSRKGRGQVGKVLVRVELGHYLAPQFFSDASTSFGSGLPCQV